MENDYIKLQKKIAKSKKKKLYVAEENSAYAKKSYVPWKVYPVTDKSPPKESLSFSWTAVFLVTFSFKDNDDECYPIIPCKIASKIPNAMNNCKFTAAVTMLKTFLSERNVQFTISTVMTKRNLVISGIKNIWYLAEILLGLTEQLVEAHLPVPIYKEIRKIEVTAVTDIEDTILINNVKYIAEEGMEIGMKLNIKYFPTVHIAAQVLPNSVLQLEKQFSPKILEKNYGCNISFKASKRRLSSCGLEDLPLVFALHYSLFNSMYNCPKQIIVKNKIVQRKSPYTDKELKKILQKERNRIAQKVERENLEIDRKNKLFILFFKIYFLYYKVMDSRKKAHEVPRLL